MWDIELYLTLQIVLLQRMYFSQFFSYIGIDTLMQDTISI